MNRRMELLLGLALAALMARPALAQDDQKSPDAESTPAEGGRAAAANTASDPGAKAAAAGAASAAKKYDIRLQFDKDSAKGEILCKGGKEKDGGIEYDQCSKDKLNNYDSIAVEKGIVGSKEAYGQLPPEQQDAAKKVAFFDSARAEAKAEMDKAAGNAADPAEYKKYKGVYRRMNKEYRHSLNKCRKYAGALKCPEAPKAPDAAAESPKAGGARAETPAAPERPR